MTTAIEIDQSKLPVQLTPLNLKAYFFNAFNMCGCSETDEILTEIIRLLEWHESDKETKYMHLYPGYIGVFYLLSGLLDSLNLSEHGTSARFAWLTEDGKRLLTALKQYSADEIENATGEAYDGCWYGDH